MYPGLELSQADIERINSTPYQKKPVEETKRPPPQEEETKRPPPQEEESDDDIPNPTTIGDDYRQLNQIFASVDPKTLDFNKRKKIIKILRMKYLDFSKFPLNPQKDSKKYR